MAFRSFAMFTQPAVPYGCDALEPVISERLSPFQHRSHP
jgi:hypothetical protein